jgi:hypothetical protein
MARLTIDDILEDHIDGDSSDPIIADHISSLSQQAAYFLRSLSSTDWLENYEATLGICRTLQKMRLEVGELTSVDRKGRRRISEELDPVLERVGDVDAYILHFPSERRDYVRRALLNIIDRHDEVHADPDSGIGDVR